jgi:two-component system response regulator HydG
MNGTILVIDDDGVSGELLRDLLRKRGLDVTAVTSAQHGLDHLQTHPTDVVLTDVRMPGISGIDLCAMLRERHPDLLPIVVTGHGDLETALAAIRAGAYDFITKPVTLEAVELAVSRALEYLTLHREVKRLRTVGDRGPTIHKIAGESRAIREIVELVRRVAKSDASVLITGESGTGKELVAHALHDWSPRRDRPFVAVNCSAMPAPLLESELFGHVRGAFTDARHDRKGLFVTAEGGTILLDEIGDMPIQMQVKLLRVLQQRTVRPVGGDEEVRFDARVITSTNRDLEAMVAERAFREDLFYRINVVQISVPPLRERADDILALAQAFVDHIARRTKKPVRGFSAPAARMLVDYDWPGNIRELENCVERAVALCGLDEITIDDLPARVAEHESSKMVVAGASRNELITLEDMERRYVRHVLDAFRGNKTHAARVLGMDRRSLYRRLAPVHAFAAPDALPVPA